MSAPTGTSPPATATEWPVLSLDEWNPTRDTLHRWVQIIGKTRLALASPVNHWWHVALYATAQGLTTSSMPYGAGAIEIELDFVHHELRVTASDGSSGALQLGPRSVAQFYAEYLQLLGSLGVRIHLWPVPREMEDEVPFTHDEKHRSYDPDQAHRCWRILSQSSRVFQAFRGGFIGKCSPVHFFWGGFDLACTRFSGRRAPVHPGGIPHLPDWVVRESYSHECISAGWWPGIPGGPVADSAFYAYAYPEPPGFAQAKVLPASAYYSSDLREFILPYEVVRSATRPDEVLTQFLQTTYVGGAALGNWDRAALERQPS